MGVTHKPDEKSRKQVTLMAGIGLKQAEIARILDISTETLTRYYKKELENAVPQLNAQVANNLFRIATSPDHKGAVTAAIFWMKTRAKWKETVDLSNDDGSLKPEAVQIAVMSALKKAHDKD
jgi:DNA-binding XRE family transcriptional regulator